MRNLQPWALAIVLPLLNIHAPAPSQILIGSTAVDTSTIASGLDTPWEILWGPDDHIWLTERFGRVSRLNPETGELTELLVIGDVHEQSESGLLGMALHPGFPDTSQVFLVYNYLESNRIKERLVRYTYSGESLHSPLTLLDNVGGAGNHNGSRLAVGPDRKLYMTTGDAVNTSTSQDLGSLNGKILRMNLDGSVPADNPLAGSLIWSWGHRNPQGLVFAPPGIAYSSEHGPNSDDEVNIIRKGGNYGWPEIRGFCDQVTEEGFCADSSVVEPIAAWTPTLAVAGTDYYPYTAIPEWHHSLLVTSLKASSLTAVTLRAGGEAVTGEATYFRGWFGRLRDLCVNPEGEVFLATSNRDGRGSPGSGDDRIIRFSPSGSTTGDGSLSRSPFLLHPNPVLEEVLTLSGPDRFEGYVILYGSTGQPLDRIDLDGRASSYTLPLPPERGVYIVKITTPYGVWSEKVIRP